MKCQSLFSEKHIIHIISLSSAKLVQRVVKINTYTDMVYSRIPGWDIVFLNKLTQVEASDSNFRSLYNVPSTVVC